MRSLKCRLAVLLILATASGPLRAELNTESGAFLLQTYSPKDYGANQQNWSIVQDSRGVIYVANTDGVLEFDGISWRKIRLSIHSGVRALAIDPGAFFVGGQGIFGYLAPNADGASNSSRCCRRCRQPTVPSTMSGTFCQPQTNILLCLAPPLVPLHA